MKPTHAEIADAMLSLRTGWLRTADIEFQNVVFSRSRWHWFDAAAAISHGGDTDGGMFGLAVGSVSILPSLGVPDAPIFHIAVAPFWYGSNPLLDAKPRTVTVIARSRCLVVQVPRYLLAELLGADPARWRLIAESVTELLNLAQLVASDMQIRDSSRRALAVLLRVAGCRAGGTTAATAELSQDELAAMANLSRQTTGPILKELADVGLVTVGYRNIVLHDPAALRELVDL